MKKLLSILLMGLLVFTVSIQMTQAETFLPVDVTVTSHFDATNSTNNDLTGTTYGTTLKLQNNLSSNVDYTFAYWAINDVLTPELPIDYDFDVTSDMAIAAYFSKTGQNLAIFVDSNGNVLHFEYVLDAGTVTDPVITLPDKPGMSIADPKWDNTLTNITEDTIFVLQYENDTEHNSNDVSVSVSSDTDATLTGSGNYTYNQEVTVTAESTGKIGEAIENLNFAYWQDTETGQILSYNNDYTFTALSERTLKAIYTEVGSTTIDTIAIADVLEMRDGYYTYVGQFEELENSFALEYGIITNSVTGEFDLDTADILRYQADKTNPDTNEFVLSIPKGHFAARAYLVIRDAELDLEGNYTFTVLYSDVVNYPEIFISEYSEGSGDNKYIEIYNPTEQSITLTDYVLAIYINGATSSGNTYPLSDVTLGPAETFVLYNSGADDYIKSAGDDTSGVANFNGDDAITLEKGGVVIDVVGVIGVDPGDEWTLADGTTKEHTLIRNEAVTYGTNDFDSSQWTSYDQDDWIDISTHLSVEPTVITDTTPPVISGYTDQSLVQGHTFLALDRVTAKDNIEGMLTDYILYTIANNASPDTTIGGGASGAEYGFDTLPVGTYTIEYTVADLVPNTGTASITLTILLDTVDPVISGTSDASIEYEDDFNPLIGVTASDDMDGDRTANITYTVSDDSTGNPVAAPVDFTTLVEGTYTIDYSVSDTSGNIGTASITLTVTAAAAPIADDLFFSEYIEGSGSYNKALEIYNPTSSSIDLSDYQLRKYVNGASTYSSITLSGTLISGDVYVIGRDYEDTLLAIRDVLDLNDGIINHSGNEVYELVHVVTIDEVEHFNIIDTIGTVGTSTDFAKDVTLVRISTIIEGNTTWTTSEWEPYAQNTTTYIGAHTCVEPAE